MRNRVWAVMVGLLAAGVSAPANGEEQFSLKRVTISGELPRVALFAERSVNGTSQRPSALKAAPKVSKNAAYYVARLGDKRVLMLCDLGSQPKLYVDADQDWDLSDETPLTASAQARKPGILGLLVGRGDSPEQPRFGPISLNLVGAGATVEFVVQVEYQSEGYSYMSIRPAAYRAGEVKLAGKGYTVQVIDASFDGQYDTRFNPKDPYGSDWIAVDLDGNGIMKQATSGPSEVIPLPRMIGVGEAYYSLDVLPDGTAIRVALAKPALGVLKVDGKDLSMTMWSDSGCHTLTSEEGAAKLPAGRYRTVEILLTRKDEKGIIWRCESSEDTGKLADFRVEPGEALELRAGEPLRRTVALRGESGSAYLTFSLRGQAGEEYAAGADKGGRRQDPPTFKVFDESGATVASGSFEYG